MLIKPASGSCNLRCGYCFYHDETSRRETACFGLMSPETLENVVKKAMREAEGLCAFTFQGGEPMLAGLEFFQTYISLTKKYARPGLRVSHAIQTNGTLINDDWARFFAGNRFLVGLSMDGPAPLHDRHRTGPGGAGSFDQVWRAKGLLEKHQADFNILTVVTKANAKQVSRIYKFFVENGLWYQQYIPCLAPLDGEGKGEYALSAEDYGTFLCRLFDLWYADFIKGRKIYIRYFENLAGMLMGYPPENCGLCGHCVNQYVVEADGGIYPCDYYVLDEYFLGNLNRDGFRDLDRREAELGFIASSARQEPECVQCRYYDLCRGGCRRDRQQADMKTLGKSCFCDAYRQFFPYALPRLWQLVQQVRG